MLSCATPVKKILAFLTMSIFAATAARAVILFRTGDPAANTTAPSNDFAGSGWNYEGQFGGFLGTPIAPHFFMTATHIGQAGSVFAFQGSNYTLVNHFNDPETDLTIWQVAETFPLVAPLYTKHDEVGQHLIVIGRGTQRGGEIFVGPDLRGWNWGGSDNVQRWGENVVAAIIPIIIADTLYATFDQNGLPNECHLSGGDSGGAVFLNDGAWKLAGINYSVDGNFYTDSAGNGGFVAALTDMRDFWIENNNPPPNFVQVTGATAVPSGFYATRISSRIGWIYSVIDPGGDLDGDNISNLIEYALHLDPLISDAVGLPRVGREGNFVTLTYTQVTTAGDINYVVEKSGDLMSWVAANPQNETISTVGNIQTIKAKIDIGTNTHLFVRLRVTRP
jgi:hypothetical protein